MTITSYYFGRKHYQIPYSLKRILFYLGLTVTLFLVSIFWNLETLLNLTIILLFISVAYILEKSLPGELLW